MDTDPAERGGVEWVSEFCPVKGSTLGAFQHLCRDRPGVNIIMSGIWMKLEFPGYSWVLIMNNKSSFLI